MSAAPATEKLALKAPESSSLAAGSTLNVQLLEVLDSSNSNEAPFVVGRIPENVMGSDGRLAFPAGSRALLIVRQSDLQKNISTLALSLHSVFADGWQVRFTDGKIDRATAVFTEDAAAGPAHRSVHLAEDTLITFKVQSAVPLK